MKILIACEESQVECKAFRAAGHEAFSCDIQPCSGGCPEWHIQGDVLEVLNPKRQSISGDSWHGLKFRTQDGVLHCVDGRWDMIIAHPPCTFLSKAGATALFGSDGLVRDLERYDNMCAAADFFLFFLEVDCPRVAIENPVPLKIAGLPSYDQIVEPFYFGDPWYKTTCFWLKGLPPLVATNIVRPLGHWVNTGKSVDIIKGHRSAKLRSKSFAGIADAMVKQWGKVDLNMQISFFDYEAV